MQTSQHTRADRLRIARLAGTVRRRAYELRHSECTLAEALTELHEISTDPHLLAHAPCGPGHPDHEPEVELAVQAGADPADIAALWADHAERWARRNNLS